jgi:hypothetical protein
MEELDLDFIIGTPGNIEVESAKGEVRPAKGWVSKSGRMRTLRNIRLTKSKALIPIFVAVKDTGMKSPWLLAPSSICP